MKVKENVKKKVDKAQLIHVFAFVLFLSNMNIPIRERNQTFKSDYLRTGFRCKFYEEYY